MATFFLGVGYFMHKYERVWQERSWLVAVAFVLLLCGVYIQPTGLLPAATVSQWGMVLLTGTCGFVFVHWLCSRIDAHPGTWLRRSLLYVGEKTWDNLEIRVYPGADGSFTLYEDEGDGYNYEKGYYATITFHWNDKARQLTIGTRQGGYQGMILDRKFTIVLPDGTSRTVTHDGNEQTIRL